MASALENRPQQLVEELLARCPAIRTLRVCDHRSLQTGPLQEHRRVGVVRCVAEAAPRRPDPNCVSSISFRPAHLPDSGAHDKHDEYPERERVHDPGRRALDVDVHKSRRSDWREQFDFRPYDYRPFDPSCRHTPEPGQVRPQNERDRAPGPIAPSTTSTKLATRPPRDAWPAISRRSSATCTRRPGTARGRNTNLLERSLGDVERRTK
jgi:hypothetical protein